MIRKISFLYHALGDFWFMNSEIEIRELKEREINDVVELLEEEDGKYFFEDYSFEVEIEDYE